MVFAHPHFILLARPSLSSLMDPGCPTRPQHWRVPHFRSSLVDGEGGMMDDWLVCRRTCVCKREGGVLRLAMHGRADEGHHWLVVGSWQQLTFGVFSLFFFGGVQGEMDLAAGSPNKIKKDRPPSQSRRSTLISASFFPDSTPLLLPPIILCFFSSLHREPILQHHIFCFPHLCK